MGVMMGVRDEDTVSSLAGRLARLDKQLDDKEQARIEEAAGGVALAEIVARPRSTPSIPTGSRQKADASRARARSRPTRSAIRPATSWSAQAANVFTGPLIELLDSIRRDKEQTIDHDNLDTRARAPNGSGDADGEREGAGARTSRAISKSNRDEIEALTIFLQPAARRSEVTYAMIKAVAGQLKSDRPKPRAAARLAGLCACSMSTRAATRSAN